MHTLHSKSLNYVLKEFLFKDKNNKIRTKENDQIYSYTHLNQGYVIFSSNLYFLINSQRSMQKKFLFFLNCKTFILLLRIQEQKKKHCYKNVCIK